MRPDEGKTVTAPQYNTFKNVTIHRGTLSMPLTTSGPAQTQTIQLTLEDPASFLQLYIYGTDYDDYFRFLDSQYHDRWLPIECTRDFLVFDSPVTQLFYYSINYTVSGNIVTLNRVMYGASFGAPWNVSQIFPKFAFVEYTLAEQFS